MTLPSLENLRCFLAGAQALNFRAAAKAVHLTPAAYGARIQQLEEQLGVRLFARTTRHVALTEAGHALVAVNEVESDPIHKATIVPRGHALGMVTQVRARAHQTTQ